MKRAGQGQTLPVRIWEAICAAAARFIQGGSAASAVVNAPWSTRGRQLTTTWGCGSPPADQRHYRPSACTISSVIFFASPNSIMVFGRKNSSLSTPAYPDAMERFTNNTVPAFSTSRIGMP